jgi:exodeoxyribonuclease-3
VRIAGIYLPNGNPQPGPKFDYKLRWMERLRARMAELKALEIPAIVTGDFNVIPTDADIWNPKAMADDALMQPESRDAYRLLNDGWTDAIATHNPNGACGPIGIIRRARGKRTMGFASTTRCSRPNWRTDWWHAAWTRRIVAGKKPATMRPSGSKSAINY